MLRDLAVVLACALTGAVVAVACSSPESCSNCCETCVSGGSSCATTHNCGDTGVPPDAGPTCTATPAPRHVCQPGAMQACLSIPKSPPTPTCVSGLQTCNAAGTGFGVCDDVLPRPDSCTLPTTFDCGGDPPACGDATWATSIPGSGNEVARSIAVDANGDVVIAASDDGGNIVLGGTTLPSASPGFFVAKLDATGAPLWGAALDNATSAAVAMDDVGNVYVTGTFSTVLVLNNQTPLTNLGDGGAEVPTYLLKLDPDGNLVWAVAVAAFLRGNEAQPFIEPTAVAVVQGSPVIAGNYSGKFLLDGSTAPSIGQDGFVARYDPTNGKLVWVTQVGTSADDTLSAIATDDAGDIVVGGHTDGTATCPTPHLLFAELAASGATTFVAEDKAPVAINAIAVVDDTIFATGVAARPVGVRGVVVDAPGFVLAAAGSAISWFVPVAFKGEGITVDANEHLTAVGETPEGGSGIVKLDSASDRFFQHAFSAYPMSGETSAEIGMHAVALAPDHGVYVAGGIRGQAELALGFGGKPVSSALGGDADAFVARFAP